MDKKQYNCPSCNKVYSSYHNMWRHKKEKHGEIITNDIILDNYKINNICGLCNKILSDRKSRWRHETKTCKKRDKTNISLEPILNQISTITLEDKIKLLENKLTQELDKACKHSYIYLIEKYDVNYNIPVYKFGKSERPIYKRLKDHGTEAKIILVMEVEDCHQIELDILTILSNDACIIKRNDIGNEYFGCVDKKYIKQLIFNNINK